MCVFGWVGTDLACFAFVFMTHWFHNIILHLISWKAVTRLQKLQIVAFWVEFPKTIFKVAFQHLSKDL